MCYSAQIKADYHKYVRQFGADIDINEFVRLYWDRGQGSKAKIPKAMDAAFAEPQSEDERRIRALIADFDQAQVAALEQEIFKQRKRLADAERTLLTKTTKKAQEDKRIATIRAGNVEAWLDPATGVDALQAILEDRDRPYYEHRLAA